MAAYRIPDNDIAAFPTQAQIFEVDIAILAAAYAGFRVVSGCAVAAQGSPDMTVAVAAGAIEAGNGLLVAVTGGNLTVGAAHATLQRIDLISISSAGVKTITAGTAATTAAVKPPSLPAGHTALALVTVLPTVTEIESDVIMDRRLFVEPFGPVADVAHGALGSAKEFDFADGSSQSGVLDDDCDVTLATNTPAGQEAILAILIKQAASGGPFEISSWDAAITWSGGIAPQIGTDPDDELLVVFRTIDGAASWTGIVPGPGVGVPTGGTIGQILAKATGTDYDTEWVDPGSGDVTTTTNPELKVVTSGTTIDMSGATSGTGVTPTDVGDGLTLVKFTDNSHQHWDVSQALGTGDFDLRCRIVASGTADLSSTATTTYGGLVVTDSSRTAGSRQICSIVHLGSSTVPSYVRGITNTGFVGNPASVVQYPIILRISRTGTTLSMWYSLDEGHSWTKIASLSSVSTDFQKVGLNATNNSGGNPQFVVDRIWLA